MRTAIELLISKFRALSVLKRGFLLAFAAVACFMILALLTRPATKLGSVPGPEYLPLENSAGALQFEPDSLVDEEKLEKTQANLAIPGIARTIKAGEMGRAVSGAMRLN